MQKAKLTLSIIKIAAKEADETEYWLVLCEMSNNYPKKEILKEKLHSIINIQSKIISTSKAHSFIFKSSNCLIFKLFS